MTQSFVSSLLVIYNGVTTAEMLLICFTILQLRTTFKLLSCIISVFYKVSGLSFNTEPTKTILAFTGSNLTFKWSLNLTAEEKTKEMWVHFGIWDINDHEISDNLLKILHKPSGQQNIIPNASPVARRWFWTGDLSRNYYVSFLLINVQRTDKGSYGLRFKVHLGFHPREKNGIFNLSVEV